MVDNFIIALVALRWLFVLTGIAMLAVFLWTAHMDLREANRRIAELEAENDDLAQDLSTARRTITLLRGGSARRRQPIIAGRVIQ
jgi:cell division protein FtsB